MQLTCRQCHINFEPIFFDISEYQPINVKSDATPNGDNIIIYTISQPSKIKGKQSLLSSHDLKTITNSHNTNISTIKDSKSFQSQTPMKHSTQPIQQNEVFRERSIEETEAAHDLLSLSQSLPPLPAPCVVTILNPDQNYDPNVNEISTSYVTSYQNNTRNTFEIHYKVHENASNSNHPQLSYSNDNNQSRENVSPLTPPASESSSDTEQSSSYLSESSNSTKSVKRKSKNSKSNRNGDAKVYAMTIFDSVMINDGRTKKGNGDAEVIHVEEKRQGRYKCPLCEKQYATSSNLSRHKQTHRSLDSQSAKKCHTCGKAYVSMPALAMHLLTHKLTHSCGVCGKRFSRPWLLQGHQRSHSGEKPYGCSYCGKAFADRSNLRAHMQTHSINKQYECSRCGKSFALKSYLNKHLESSCLRDEFKKFFEDGEVQRIEDDDNYDDDEDIIVT
ncbi:Transcriptional repressor scratch 1 [Pseudolycoriella hygida]|uniref:Escargot/snail protein homolog n=1 Tax=Pseudolycoriella hygida TaxID=35572 RepID=A0A9Q0S0B9_9DIPT|nr:Transcriptional repressor scratch 1 [Pseudolycoriella hygida]